ncbi:EAL domain-containing protein [Euzebya sp.]|uniref:EAL domain-containing protein n=1 Tax=Euzebya sp. TaxID=1971409 RepID=UPI003511FE32
MQAITASDVHEVLDTPGSLRTVFQPIVDLWARRTVGFEALCRVTIREPASPGPWLAAARRAGLGLALESKAFAEALRALPTMRDGRFLSMNLSLEALAWGGVGRRLRDVDPERVVVEITEDVAMPAVPHRDLVLDGLRARGLRLAIDDVGTGYSSLARILEVRPDLIKVDRELVQGCAVDPSRRIVLQMIRDLAASQDGEVIAEGVEDLADLQVVEQIGIRYAQGFLLGRPGDTPTDVVPPAATPRVPARSVDLSAVEAAIATLPLRD